MSQCGKQVILSDIKLLDGDSFELFCLLGPTCPIIFCTAYSQYMQDAFDTNGIAFLVKPYSQEAFNKAMQKYEQLFSTTDSPVINRDMAAVLKQILQSQHKKHKQRFSIRKNDGIMVKQTADILFFRASGDFCTLIDKAGERHNVNYKISELENVLDSELFFRINRSEMVNISFIQKVEPYFKNKLKIILSDATTLTTSGAKTPQFRLWLDGK